MAIILCEGVGRVGRFGNSSIQRPGIGGGAGGGRGGYSTLFKMGRFHPLPLEKVPMAPFDFSN